ncbi:EamA-like transporter family protein [mine drainage metagenome]|uniref:EamA-like transporter family protein n=1 Tax=mine drainage metagenome TaxID=410659 RepID=A0A1J5RS05_9ZZZZ
MGDLLALLSACSFAGANVTITRGANGQDNGAFLSILVTTVIAGAIWLHGGWRQGWAQFHTAGLLWFAAAGVLTIFVGRVFLYASVQHVGAIRASAIKRLTPLFSVLLGVLVLGEPFDSSMAIGMLLIFSSFVVLVRQSLSAGTAPRQASGPGSSRAVRLVARGFFYGPISAFAYAAGYVARKQGLNSMPEPAFGAMLGSAVGAVVFVVAARFIDSYRLAVRNAFTTFNPWLFAAGVLSSMGQILYFGALTYSTMSRVALISSAEVFVTMLLTVAVFRSREQLSAPVMLAAGLGTAGTVFIIFHL